MHIPYPRVARTSRQVVVFPGVSHGPSGWASRESRRNNGVAKFIEPSFGSAQQQRHPARAGSQFRASTALASDEASGCVVPWIHALLDVGMKPALSDVAQVQGARPQTTNVADLWKQTGRGLRLDSSALAGRS